MNPVEKPKSVKLWKNSGASGKKQKMLQKNIGTDAQMSAKKKNKQKKLERSDIKMETDNDFSSKGDAVENSSFDVKCEIKISISKKDKSLSLDEKHKKQGLKRKNDSPDSLPKKKGKPNDISRKDWKMLHLDKKTKSGGKSEIKKESADQTKPMNKKEWKLKKLEKKGKKENFELGQKLKSLWEDFRREDCKPEKKRQLLNQACGILKGRVKEFTFAHDTVRVLESIVAEGSDAERALVFTEVQNDILPLTKNIYSRFIIMKLLKYGSKEQKNTIMKAFHGKVVHLMRHTFAAEVVEMAFNECANSFQRFEFVQEFYGPTYKYFKTTDCHTLSQLLEKEPDKKSGVIQHMKEELKKVLEKNVVKHSIIHHLLWQFMQHCDAASKSEIIEAVREAVPEILHTKDGYRVAMHCVWFGTAKDRKVIVKHMKTFVSKIAMEEHGHMVLLALFDCFDDTKLLKKRIIPELEANLLEISQNPHGRKVLIYLLNPRDPHYCHPDIINILKTGDNNETSKKDPEIRRNELKVAIAEPLLNLIATNIQSLYKDNSFCLFTLIILQHTVGNRRKVFEVIADLAVEPYTSENKNVHVIEHPGGHFLFKKLIVLDREAPKDDCTFSEVLITKIPKLVFKSWMECNRGAFLLVSLLETELPSVVKRIKEDLEGCKKYLSKKSYKGAEILLRKLKD